MIPWAEGEPPFGWTGKRFHWRQWISSTWMDQNWDSSEKYLHYLEGEWFRDLLIWSRMLITDLNTKEERCAAITHRNSQFSAQRTSRGDMTVFARVWRGHTFLPRVIECIIHTHYLPCTENLIKLFTVDNFESAVRAKKIYSFTSQIVH